MDKYEVSIVVPVYNREKLIKPCIDSINLQTYDKSKWEVIFVDDASKDSTIEAIESLIDKNINYRILERPIGSGNASAPRNEGIKASLGQYIFFLDSDDYIDSELLENGMALAFKNKSDIVYVKLGGPRGINKRAFRKSMVDDADILKHHLMRSLKIFKFHRKSFLISNNILFNPSIDVFEDMLFSCACLSLANKTSILADKDYYFLEAHNEGHLSHVKMSLPSIVNMFLSGLNYIILSNSISTDKLYNAWLVKIVERFVIICRRNKVHNTEVINLFSLASDNFNLYRRFFDLTQIYDNEKILSLLFLAGDFVGFHKIANESKTLNSLQKNIQEELKNEFGYSRSWVFKDKTAVVDFILEGNKIAFDLEVDEKKKDLNIWMFCRNNSVILNTLKENSLKLQDNRLLIFNGKLNEQKEAINIIKSYLKLINLDAH